MPEIRSLCAGICVGLLGAQVAPACTGGQYACGDDGQCVDGDAVGTCEPTGFCSFDDDGCDSGRRYGDHAGQLAGQCVPIDPGSTGVDDGPTTLGSATLDDTGGETSATGGTLPLDDTGDPATGSSGLVTTASESDASTSGTDPTGSSTDGSSTTGVATCLTFEDDFERPNDEDIGNGWIEKTPDRFMVFDGRADDETSTGEFQDNLVYRPLSDSVLDLDLEIDLRFAAVVPTGNPQLHARVQADDIDVVGTLHSYVVFIDDTPEPVINIARVDSSGDFGNFAQTLLAEPLEIGVDYHLSARVEGTDPVVVEGTLERWDGVDWVIVGEVELEDSDAERITTPGAFGFSGHDTIGNYSYDNFEMDERNCP